MTTYFTDFSEYSTGSAPPDWSEPYNSQFGWPVETDAGSPGGQRLTVERPNVTAEPHVLTWDDVDSDAERQDAEVLALIEFPSTPDGQLGFVARATGAEDAEEMYNCTVSLGGFNTFRFVNGSFTQLVSGSHSFSAGDLIWVRFRVNGSTIRLRIWQDGTSEPGTWDVDTTDSNITGDGSVGIYAFSDDLADAYVHQIGVGTGGDTAPDSESSGPAAASGSPGDVVDDLTAETDWTGAATGITEHELHRSTSSGFTPGASTRVMDSLPTTSASFTLSDGPADSLDPPDPDTTYYYVLRSIDSGGTTDSDEVEIQTAPPRPRLPKEGHNAVAESRMDTDTNGDGVVDGFSDIETGVLSPANPFSVDTAEGAQKLEATDTDSGGELGVGYQNIDVSGGEEWNVHVGSKFSGLTVDMAGKILFIWRDAADLTVQVDESTDLSHTTLTRTTTTFTAPSGAETLDVRLEMAWSAAGQAGTAWYRDLQVIQSGAAEGESFIGSVTDEAAGKYVTRFWVRHTEGD